MAQSNLFRRSCSEMNNGANVGEKNIESLHADNCQDELSFNNHGKDARKNKLLSLWGCIKPWYIKEIYDLLMLGTEGGGCSQRSKK